METGLPGSGKEMNTLIVPGFGRCQDNHGGEGVRESERRIGMEIKSASILNHMDFGPTNLLMPVEPVQMECSEDKPPQLRAWMIHDHFKCPVVGTCLGLNEQKKILKKAGYSSKNCSAHKIHGILVQSLSDKGRLSERIDTLLNRKFKQEIDEFSGLERPLFLDAWKRHFKKGEIAGLFWVAATRPDIPEEDIEQIFGDIHMQMHLDAANDRKLRQELCHQQEQIQKLDQRVTESSKIKRALKKENEKLERELAASYSRYVLLEGDKKKLESKLLERLRQGSVVNLEAENEELRHVVARSGEESGKYRQRVKVLEAQNRKLMSRLERRREMDLQLREEMKRTITELSALKDCDETCPSFDLCKKRILVVGGITKLESRYRQLIEENGGVFEYHDGYMKGGPAGLENKVRRAEVVLCPVNCNSHTACSMVKRLGKKHKKPIHMLAGSSLSAVFQALSEYNEGPSIQ